MGALRRNTELGLVILAAMFTAGLYALASLGNNASIPADIGPFLGVVLALLLAAHIATRRLAPYADGMLLPLAVLLNGIGYVFIVRLADDIEGAKALPGLQATWTFLGVAAYVGTLIVVRRSRALDRYRYTLALLGVALLLLPLVPGVGRLVNGSRIWIRVGPVSFQPGEFAKIALAVFFASYLVEKRELLRTGTYKLGPLRLPEPKHLAPVLLAWGISLVVLIMEKDLGSSLLFFAVFVAMLWIATDRLAYVVLGALLFGLGAYFSYRQFGHVQTRFDNWIDPWRDARGKGYQSVQAQFAFAGGGVAGSGPGLGRPTLIPAVHTDFIFAAIGEELGLLGSSAVLFTYLLFVGSGFRIAMSAQHPFEKLLATGLTALVGVQAFIIIGGVIRVVPLTGITLPFVSYGGSSLLSNYVLLALLMRISDENGRHEAEEAQQLDVQSMADR
ncbi:MAG TPA: FtsW/RodA/SpoVE family cell cycle protein [Acidimicrobiales bacterium]|nr:FtsW/RodA/SpoVE family cell cycle protein [Acidimicrobiales bacterium]